MAHDDSYRLETLRASRDSLERKLEDLRVTEYQTQDGRRVSRESALNLLQYLNQQIRDLESRLRGPCRNRVRKVR